MFSNNKGSGLSFALIIFSLIIIISTNSIEVVKSSYKMIDLHKKEFQLKEEVLNFLELLLVNVSIEIDNKIKSIQSEQEFNDYFLDQNFAINLSNIYNSKKIQTKVTKNKENVIDYKIEAVFKEDGLSKGYEVNFIIENPFTKTTDDTIYNSKDLLKVYRYKEKVE